MTRLRMFLVILASAGLIATCASPSGGTSPAPPRPSRGPCGVAVAHPDRPIICVDDSSAVLRVWPDPVLFHDVVSGKPGMSPGILWFTRSGKGKLEIVFRDKGCVRDVKCEGGRCIGAADRLDSVQDRKVCKYDVLLSGHEPLDPETVIVRCCALEGTGGD